MYKEQIKVFEVAKGELPGTSRTVLGWGVSSPKLVEYNKKLRKFFWGEVLVSVEYWVEFKQMEAGNDSKRKG